MVAPVGEAAIPFFQVPVETLEVVWPLVKKRLEAVEQRSKGLMPVGVMRSLVEEQKWQLWVALNPERKGEVLAVALTELMVHPNGAKSAKVWVLTGDCREKWYKVGVEILEAWAVAEGCAFVESYVRPGWEIELKPLGWRKTHVHVEKWLAKPPP